MHAAASERVTLERERCKGCYLCLDLCPNELFHLDDQPNQQGIFPVRMDDADFCMNCLRCVDVCPDQALHAPANPRLNWSGLVFWGSLNWHRWLQRFGRRV